MDYIHINIQVQIDPHAQQSEQILNPVSSPPHYLLFAGSSYVYVREDALAPWISCTHH